MKKLILTMVMSLAALVGVLNTPAKAALGAVVWELRPGTGSGTGCYDPGLAGAGTDYSLNNAPVVAATDLVVGTPNTSVSSVSWTFGPVDQGNCIYIGAGTGFSQGMYEVVGYSGTSAILDRSPGATGISGGTWDMGGANTVPDNIKSFLTGNNVVWIKSTGSISESGPFTVNISSAGAPGTPLSFIGYATTRGDGGQVQWSEAISADNLFDVSGGYNILFKNIYMTGTASTGSGIIALTGNAVQVRVENCVVTGFEHGIFGNYAVAWDIMGLFLINSRVTSNTGYGIINTGATSIFGSEIDTNGSDGVQWSAGGGLMGSAWWNISHSIIYNNGGRGINVQLSNTGGAQLPTMIIDHVDISSNGHDGILTGNDTNPWLQISNSIFDNNGTSGSGYGVSTLSSFGTTIPQFLGYNNAFYNNASGPTHFTNNGTGTITLTADPYFTIGSDFSLNTSSGGGALLKYLGWPGVMPGGTGASSVGAIQ